MRHQSIKAASMRYLGTISGDGMLTWEGQDIAPASYEFEGYMQQEHVTSCGEIHSPANILRGVFGRTDVQLRTQDGRMLTLKFSEKTLPPNSTVAHVDVTGDHSSDPQDWRH